MNPALSSINESNNVRKSGVNLRIKNIYAELDREDLDGLIVTSPANITYLTNYISRDAYLLVSKKGNIYFTDFRYIEETKRNLKGYILKRINGSVFKIIASACGEFKLKRVGFEERHMSFAEYKTIKENLNNGIDLVPTHSIVEGLRQVKTQEELEKIKKAANIAIESLKFVKDFISPGKKEIEVAAELERFIRYNGGYTASFDIIVASGPNSSFPHHMTSQRKLKNHEPVLIDVGIDYLGYKSDLTRIFFLGKINLLARRIYDIVCAAQARAIEKIKPAVSINKIDAAGRQYIAQRGFGEFFGHNLGHGIGLEVHEEPHISGKEHRKLKPGMVFTIEPAIYLPDKFGIRIEDMVLVTKEGVEVISDSLDKRY